MTDPYQQAWERFVRDGTISNYVAGAGERAAGRTTLLTFAVMVAGDAEVARRIGEVQRPLAALPEADPLPRHWLHVTVQSVGFLDDPGLDAEQVGCIPAEAEAKLRDARPFTVRLRNAGSFREAAFVEAHEGGEIRRLRAALREALPAVARNGADQLFRDGVDRFLPHLSIAYYNRSGPADRVIDALGAFRPYEVGTLAARSIELVAADVSAPHRFPALEVIASVPLGGGA